MQIIQCPSIDSINQRTLNKGGNITVRLTCSTGLDLTIKMSKADESKQNNYSSP